MATDVGRYCIVGAGAAGLASIQALRAAGLEVDCFEQTGRTGGHWNTDYRCLHLITPRDASGYVGDPMPDAYPLFPSRQQVLDYIVGFGERHDLVRHVTFETGVERAEPVDGGWRVRTTDGRVREYAGLVVANGHLWDPFVPAVEGTFTGRQIHSGAYQDVGDIAGERVLVVGSGNSGCDLASDCAQSMLDVTISVRSGHLFQPKTFLGRPRGELPIMKLPPRLQDHALRALIRLSVGAPERYGLPAPETWNLMEQRPVVNSLLLHWLQHGRVQVAPGIRRFDGREVEFADGTRQTFDTILWCTGFSTRFPFLDAALLRWRDAQPLRVAGCILPFAGPPRLYLNGLCAPRGPQLPVYSHHGRLIARMIRLEGRLDAPVVDVFSAREEPEHRIDLVRSVWQAQMDAAEATLDELEGRAPAAPTGLVGRSRRAVARLAR